MKRQIIFALTLIFMILFYAGCIPINKVSEQVVETETIQPNMEKWKQVYYPEIKVGDPIFFYNSVEIVMEGEFFNRESFLDGSINIIQTKKVLEKTISAMTTGKLLSFKKDNNGNITDMFVSFSPTDKTYYLNFKLTSDGSFNLNGNAKLFFEGKEYPVLATIKGEVCKLLCIVNFEEKIDYIIEKAEGMQ